MKVEIYKLVNQKYVNECRHNLKTSGSARKLSPEWLRENPFMPGQIFCIAFNFIIKFNPE
jgi:hypothetical protein